MYFQILDIIFAMDENFGPLVAQDKVDIAEADPRLADR